MTTVDVLIAAPTLAGLRCVGMTGGDREVSGVRLAEQFVDLAAAPPGSLVVLGRAASESATDYRFDMALRWAALAGVAAVAGFAPSPWQPTSTATDIADRAHLALIWIPAEVELTDLLQAASAEVSGGPALALARARAGLAAVEQAEREGASLDTLCVLVSMGLGTPVTWEPTESGPVRLSAPDARGDLRVAASLVLRAAAAAAAGREEAARRSRDLPVRSRSELLAELLISESALNEELLDRARDLGVPVAGWHVAVQIEADNLAGFADDELRRYEVLESAGQLALSAAAAAGGTWHLSRVGRAIVLIWMTSSDPGPVAGPRASRSAQRALAALADRFPGLVLRAGVGPPHHGPLGLRASAAAARGAIIAARLAGRPPGVTAHDATGMQRMLIEWCASDTTRQSLQSQLAPLDRLGKARAETAIRTLSVFLDEQGSIVKTAQRLHLHRNAVTYRLRRITSLLGVDLGDADQRLALQLACRARLLW